MNIIRYKEKASWNRSQRSRIGESRHLPPQICKTESFNPFNKYTFSLKKNLCSFEQRNWFLIKMIELWVLVTFRIFRMADSPSKVNHGLMGSQPFALWQNIHDPLFNFQWCCWFLDDIMVLADSLHMGIDSKSWNAKSYTHDHICSLASDSC